MQGSRERVLDSRGRPVPGLYVRDGRFIAGFNVDGKWRTRKLRADTLTEARRERESMLAGLREGRMAAPSDTTFRAIFEDYQDARNLSERTRKHERDLARCHLSGLADRRAQDVTAADVGRVLRGLRDRYSPWTCVAVYRIVRGTFAHGVRRGILTRSPADGLAPSEIPKQRNARPVAVLDADSLAALVGAASTERWRAALGLAAFAGLRVGEIRALRWGNVDLAAGTLTVDRSMGRDDTERAPKTAAGVRVVPILPALRRALVEWRMLSDSALSKQLGTLEDAGYVTMERPLSERRRRVRARLTPLGRKRFASHVAALRTIIADAVPETR